MSIRRLCFVATILVVSALATTAQTRTVRVGVLHSLTGTMAISETSLKDAVLLAVEEINARGGVLGRQIEPIVVDPASDWPLFAQRAQELLRSEVAVVFGTWTSVSRKSVLPVFESMNGLLFYPLQYEGEEQSPNIFYTGAVPNQQMIPAVEYLMRPEGGSKRKFYLLGTDYVFPRTANKVLRAFLLSKGIPEANIYEEYTPFGHANYQDIVRKIRSFGAAGDTVVLNTIVMDSNIPFFREFAAQGLRPSQIPIMSFSIAEDELRALGPETTASMTGHLAAWNYFQSIDTADNRAFVDNFKRRYGAARVTDDPIEASYSGVYAWKAAVEKAGSFDVNRVREALSGLSFNSPAGAKRIHKDNHHTAKPFLIGRIRGDGQFDVVYKSMELIEPESFSPHLASFRPGAGPFPRNTAPANGPGRAANLTPAESRAIENLRMINTAQVTYLSVTEGRYGDIKGLIGAGLLDSRFAEVVGGYSYSIAVLGNRTDFIATALPASPESGRYAFFTTPDGVVRYLVDPRGGFGDPVR